MAKNSRNTAIAARDIVADGVRQGADRRDWAFEVEDKAGCPVLTYSFPRAVETAVPTSR